MNYFIMLLILICSLANPNPIFFHNQSTIKTKKGTFVALPHIAMKHVSMSTIPQQRIIIRNSPKQLPATACPLKKGTSCYLKYILTKNDINNTIELLITKESPTDGIKKLLRNNGKEALAMHNDNFVRIYQKTDKDSIEWAPILTIPTQMLQNITIETDGSLRLSDLS